jgi:hypothetical protein
MYSATITRSYRDADGQWHDATSFGFEDMLTVAKAMYDAHSFVTATITRERAAAREAEGNKAR